MVLLVAVDLDAAVHRWRLNDVNTVEVVLLQLLLLETVLEVEGERVVLVRILPDIIKRFMVNSIKIERGLARGTYRCKLLTLEKSVLVEANVAQFDIAVDRDALLYS